MTIFALLLRITLKLVESYHWLCIILQIITYLFNRGVTKNIFVWKVTIILRVHYRSKVVCKLAFIVVPCPQEVSKLMGENFVPTQGIYFAVQSVLTL